MSVIVECSCIGLGCFVADCSRLGDVRERLTAFAPSLVKHLRISYLSQDANALNTRSVSSLGLGDTVTAGTRVRVSISGLSGGKGGFGAILKAAGKRHGNAITNLGFCRDLNGRRLRHVNAEQRLRVWASPEEVERRHRLGSAYREPRGETRLTGWHMPVPVWARLPGAELKSAARLDKRSMRKAEAALSEAEQRRADAKATKERSANLYAAEARAVITAAVAAVGGAVAAGLEAEAEAEAEAAALRGVNASAVYAAATKVGAVRGAGAASDAASDAAAAGGDSDDDDWLLDVDGGADATEERADAEESGVEAAVWLEEAPGDGGSGETAAISHGGVSAGGLAALGEATAAAAMATVWCPRVAVPARQEGGAPLRVQFEAVVLTGGVAQVGWAAVGGFACRPAEGEGVGDDEAARSVGWDGSRGVVWRGGERFKAGGAVWRPGDVVGCVATGSAAASGGEATVQVEWTVNGAAAASSELRLPAGSSICPAVTAERGESVQLNLGADILLPLAFPAAGALPVALAPHSPPAGKRARESETASQSDGQGKRGTQ